MNVRSASHVRHLGELSAAGTVALALGLGLVASAAGQSDLGPPETVPRGVALALLFSTPGLIGFLGARSARPALLFAAGILCALQSIVAFSGITLVFLLPALGFLRTATPGRESPSGEVAPGARFRPSRIVLLVALAIPVALLVVRFGGVFAVVALVVAAGVAGPARARLGGARSVLPGAVVMTVLVGLGVAAAVALFATTEEVCWILRSDGSYVRVPSATTMTLRDGEAAGGCDGGELTTRGALLSGGLAGTAVIVALAASVVRPHTHRSGPELPGSA